MAPVYVQFGCGHSAGKDWLNFDSSQTLRIERLPLVGTALARLSRNRGLFPANAGFGDVSKGLPVASGSVRGVYASHVIATMTLDELDLALEETLRVLEPGGVFRVVTPDLKERARRYVTAADAGSAQAAGAFIRGCLLGRPNRPHGAIGRMRQVYGRQYNLWMWDEPSLVQLLQEAGFASIRRCKFGDCHDPMFAQVEEPARFFDPAIGIEEVALEARKPR